MINEETNSKGVSIGTVRQFLNLGTKKNIFFKSANTESV